jgi:hypothetical protein
VELKINENHYIHIWHDISALTKSKYAKRTKIAMGLKHRGPKLWFSYMGGQNRNILKVRGGKVPFSQINIMNRTIFFCPFENIIAFFVIFARHAYNDACDKFN